MKGADLNIIDNNRLSAFRKRYTERLFAFACHAAVPRVFSTDLLYKIWLNFQTDIEGKALDIPLTSVAEIINSPICNELGTDLYEFYPDIKSLLLTKWQNVLAKLQNLLTKWQNLLAKWQNLLTKWQIYWQNGKLYWQNGKIY